MINVEKDNRYVYIYDNGKLLKTCEFNELSTISKIDDVIDECIFPYCVSSHAAECLEHHSKRLYLKIQLHKLMNINF